MDYVLGIDVYSLNSPDDSANAPNNDPVKKAANWKAVYDAGVRFAYIKATEFVPDKGYADRMQNAKNAGLLRGAYMLPHFENDTVAAQVKLFVDTVGSDKGELPPMLDLESPGGNWPRGKVLLKRVQDCLARLEDAFGRKPIIYTSQSIVRDFQITNPPWGKDYPLWVAAYPWIDVPNKLQYSDPNNPPKWSQSYPPQPDGYQPWIIWQWTEKGKLAGLGQEHVDINMFKGTYADFLAWAGASEPVPVPIPEGEGAGVIQQTQHVVGVVRTVEQGEVVEVQVETHEETTVKFITHLVQQDDNLSMLALKYHTSIPAIMALNPQITNPNIIITGDTLKIPQ